MHDYWMVGTTIALILAGILFNRQDVGRVEARMDARFEQVNARFDQMNARFDGLQRDLNGFYQILGSHDARLEHLEKRRPQS